MVSSVHKSQCPAATLRAAIRSTLFRQVATLSGTALLSVSAGVSAAELPVVCVAGSCGARGPSSWVTSGSATATSTQNTLTINQTSDRAILNWASFNVSADGRVIFNQPAASSIALNRIYQDSPSQIFGAVEANGQVYLVNPNGFVFGRTARIDAAGILASTLSISDATFAAGLLSPDLLQGHQAALASDGRVNVLNENGEPVLGADGKPLEVRLVVEEGAKLQSRGSGGRVMLASREIDNAGTISSPDGQVLLAAGDKVYLQASSDPKLRGLLVEVDAGGEAWNRLTGKISAARGNVTVAGLAVNQSGRISATTTVAANGSIRLQARDTATFINASDNSTKLGPGQNGGRLDIGSGSTIEVLPELGDTATAVDEQAQLPSQIDLSAREIFLRSGSRIVAPSGQLHVSAAANPASSAADDPSARIRVEANAEIDLSGSDATLPMSRNLVTVELRANELRDSPTQRNGALRGQTVVVDARIGTPLADVSGALAAIPKSIAERTSQGGSSVFDSGGDIVIASDARFDVSGGVLTYTGGPLRTSMLIGADGQLYDIGTADPLRTYVGVLNPTWRRVDDRWGLIGVTTNAWVGATQAGYIEGRNAGTAQFSAPRMVLNGSLRGETVAGPYQRDPAKTPSGGELIIGLPEAAEQSTPDYRAPSVNFATHGVTITVADNAPLLGQQPLELPIDYLTRGGFTRTAIYSNGTITIPESTPLALQPGSSLSMTGHRVDIHADVYAAGGSITATSALTAGNGTALGRAGVNVDSNVTLDVRGTWTNDALSALQDPFGRPTTSLFNDGGSIALLTKANDAELIVGNGVRLLASGGARLRQDGSLDAGNGGSIELSAASRNGALALGDAIALEAFGVLGAEGGKFTLAAPRLQIGTGTLWSGGQRIDPLEGALEYLQIGTALFTDHGFKSITLAATGEVDRSVDADALRVMGNTTIQSQARVLQLNDSSGVANRSNIAGLASVVLPPELQRQATAITLSVDPIGLDRASQVGRLNVEAGASLFADAGSSFVLSSVGGIQMDGSIRTLGGKIALTVKTPAGSVDAGYQPDLRLALGEQSVLDVSGGAIYRPNDAGMLFGTLHNAGTVDLRAERGAVIVEGGALIDVSGASAQLDRQTSSGYQRHTVGSNAGVLSIFSPEAIAFNGTLAAHAGVGETGSAVGGELVMRLARGLYFTYGEPANRPTYPTDPRVLRVTTENVVIGGPSPPNGFGVLRKDVIDSSGIDALTLQTDGSIEFDAIQLALDRRLILDTPGLTVRSGAAVDLSASHVSLGNSNASLPAAVASVGAGTLAVRGDLIEITGASSISGVAATTLSSTGDLRLREAVVGAAHAGNLQVAGDLTMRARQIYPSTLSQFSIAAVGDAATTLRIEQVGGQRQAPLSAGGRLTLTAPNIEQGGTLLAAFGSITLNASESLQLAADSLTSVSGNGAVIPFGRVENGDWIYQMEDRLPQTGIPQRQITLDAPAIEQHATATLDLRGGGDLYAYEWIPGTGGSVDALAAAAAPARYAILPSLLGQFAPYDPQEMAGSNLVVGDSVYLSGIAGLKAGFYPLLPARYALLPGAYLIESVGNTANLQPGAVASLPDGTPVVAGYRSFGNTGLGGTQYTGFAIRPGSQARQLAAYEDSFASTFYKDRAERLDLPRPVLPADAGALSLLAMTSLDMQGIVNVGAAQGGRAGRVEVAAPRIEIVANASASEDSVQLAASVLNNWRPGELWIGGTRRGATVDVMAQEVRVASGAVLNADEVVLVANNTVAIEAGATVGSQSGQSGTAINRSVLSQAELQFNGDDAGAAVVAASDRNLFDIRRAAGATTAGSVVADSGSVLRTRGSLLIDAPARAALNGDIQAAGAAWHLGSSGVRFDDVVGTDGLTIDRALLGFMQSASSLTIATPGAIDFAYALDLGTRTGLNELTLRAASLRNYSGGDIGLAAKAVRLQGVASAAAAAPGAGAGALTLDAARIEIGAGNLTVDGFTRTTLRSSGDIVGVGTAALQIGGDLDLIASRVTAGSGGNTAISAQQGTVRISGSGSASTATTGLLGGALSISANAIEHAGTLFLPSGVLSLEASSRLSIDTGALIDTSGDLVTAAGRSVGSGGGAIRLVSNGSLDVASGSVLDVSGASGASAGRLSVYSAGATAISGELHGSAGDTSHTGGAFDLYAGTLQDFGSLNARLQSGGFNERQTVHVGSGDLQLGANDRADARVLEWITDGGRVIIDGAMSALSAVQRSQIRLHGADGVSIRSGARLTADAATGVRNGGDIEIGTSNGSLAIASGSSISARGAESDGTLRLRAPATSTDVAVTSLAGTIRHVDSIVVEPVRIYNVDAAPTTAQLNAIRTETSDYIAGAASNIRGRLNPAGDLNLRIEPGIEIRREGDLQLSALNLASWRFDSNPAALTVRATGSIAVNGTISDGFSTVGTGASARLTLLDGDSATLRFAAGANLASADPNAITRNTAADLTLAPNAIIRTGTGDLQLTAARDIVFGDKAGVYTAGYRAAPAETVPLPLGASYNFPDHGGNVALTAGRDVVGAAVTQSVTDWQRRQGTPDDAPLVRRTQWGIDLRNFGWNVGTLGGGDLTVTSGRDVTNLSAAAADSAIELIDGALTRFGGGALSIQAGRDVSSAMLYAARGVATVNSGGALNSSRTAADGESLGTLIMLGDAQVNLSARQGIALEAIINPTALIQQGAYLTQRSAFLTYGDNSAVTAQSSAGNVELNVLTPRRLQAFLGTAAADENTTVLSILPSSLTLRSLSADVLLNLNSMTTLLPSDHGQLDLFAARDVSAAEGSVLTVSDGAAAGITGPLRPATSINFSEVLKFASSARHMSDAAPALITAGRDVSGAIFQLPKAVQLRAGRDIRNTTLKAQNLRRSDVTTLQAGRDITYASNVLTGEFSVGGPGRFDVLTGRNLDLGFSRGISTVGRLVNPAIADETGANLNVLVGMGRDADANAFVGGLGHFFSELVASGREVNSNPSLGFDRGYRAIDKLFAGSRATDGSNPYEGNLTLAFSRIYTLAGGDISIAVPGGLVNVGLANPPANIGSRPASELGIVAQRSGNIRIFTNDDVLVNQSRVFTLLGGDIAIWSTTGDIDAGRGAKSSVSAPPPAVLVDSTGRVTLDFAGAVAGSGIRTIATDDKVTPGDVDLIAPAGIVNAGDAGIGSAGNLNIAAQQVVGLDNIQVGGASTGVPAETSGLAAGLSGVTAVASSSSSAAASSVSDESGKDSDTPLAQTALSWLEVFVIGLGEDNCKQDDIDCLKRQKID